MNTIQWQPTPIKYEIEFKQMHGDADAFSHSRIAVSSEEQFELLLTFAELASRVINANPEVKWHYDSCQSKEVMVSQLIQDTKIGELQIRRWLDKICVGDATSLEFSYASIIGYRCFKYNQNEMATAMIDGKPYVQTDSSIAKQWFKDWELNVLTEI